MTGQELLERVKQMTNYTSDYHDGFISGWIDEAKAMLAQSGVSDEAIEGKCSVGVIAQIIVDLLDNGEVTEGTKYRIAQLSMTYPREDRPHV